mmetsp:Transcript_50219/g.144760  ORF Transcript_50219/g.144760 Transcript_50219/m.144760 type:complete len:202 (-) Transcript_50219:196-801(-)
MGGRPRRLVGAAERWPRAGLSDAVERQALVPLPLEDGAERDGARPLEAARPLDGRAVQRRVRRAGSGQRPGVGEEHGLLTNVDAERGAARGATGATAGDRDECIAASASAGLAASTTAAAADIVAALSTGSADQLPSAARAAPCAAAAVGKHGAGAGPRDDRKRQLVHGALAVRHVQHEPSRSVRVGRSDAVRDADALGPV